MWYPGSGVVGHFKKLPLEVHMHVYEGIDHKSSNISHLTDQIGKENFDVVGESSQ